MRPSSSRSRSPRARVLRRALGPDARRVGFADMEQLGRNPGRIIGAWRDFVREHGGGDAPPLGHRRADLARPHARPSSSSATATRRC